MIPKSIFIFLTIIITKSQSANILGIYPTPSVSHQIVFQTYTKDLLSRGHNLTILTPNPLFIQHPNLTEIDWSDSYTNFQRRFSYDLVKKYRKNIYGFVREACEIFVEVMEDQMNCPDMKKFMSELDRYQFDIMIFEHIGHYPYLAFSEIFKVPVIGMTSFETTGMVYHAFGSGSNIFANMEQMFPFMPNEMTFQDRLEIIKFGLILLAAAVTPPSPFKPYGKFMDEYFPQIDVGIFDLINRVEFLMVNTHPAMGFVRPLVPNTIQLGFLHIEPPKPLPEGTLKTFLDNSENGVIYMSFGTNFRSKDFEPEFIDIFLNVFKNLKFDVVWKFEDENLPNRPKNVLIQKWTPQADLLAHPKIKLFITQCGHQSSEEAIDRAVPMILMPLFSDQPGVAAKLQSKGVGRMLDITTVNEEMLKEAIDEVLKPQYKDNVIKLRELVYDQPMTSREKAVWWTEYFIRHKGTGHQDYLGRFVPWYKQLALDFLVIGIILIYAAVKIFKMVFRKSEKVKRE